MTKKLQFLILTLFLFGYSSISKATLNKEQANHLIDIHYAHRFTFFCKQAFKSDGFLILPKCKTCPNSPVKVQWMPIIPLQTLASELSCYRDKRCLDKSGKLYSGLRCCQKINPHYIKMSTDLYNYVPENPSISRLRRQYRFDDFEAFQADTSSCHFVVDNKHKRISPAPSTRGMIARTYLYFHEQYQLPLSQHELILYNRWHQMYPVTDWERTRSRLIFERQGNLNPFVLHF